MKVCILCGVMLCVGLIPCLPVGPGWGGWKVEVALAAAETEIAEIVVKMWRPADDADAENAPALTAEELAELNYVLGLNLVPVRVTHDGAQVLRFPSPLRIAEVRELITMVRMAPDVLYAEVVMPTQQRLNNQQSRKPSARPARRLSGIIVKLRDPQTHADAARNRPLLPALVDRLSQVAGVPLRVARPMSGGAYVLNLPSPVSQAEATAIAIKLEMSPLVEYAEPETLARPLLVPNDSLYPLQWHYFEPQGGVNLPAAWDTTVGSPGLVVAVIDSGILPGHPDLVGRLLPGYDMVSDPFLANDGDGRDGDPVDPGDASMPNECEGGDRGNNSSWHGTHVAGTIGATSHNNLGVTGINWRARILPVRAVGKCGGTVADVADAIRWAAGRAVPGAPLNLFPAKVINLSLGNVNPTSCSATYQNAINAALAAGATVVVAAGNDRALAALYQPANCNGVITVHATNRSGGFASYSNYGFVIDISAPGGQNPPAANAILSTMGLGTTIPTGYSYDNKQGTSMAAPHVAGIVSLLLSLNPALTPAQVLALITATARPFVVGTGADCNVSDCGAGLIDAAAAVNATPLPASADFDGRGHTDLALRHSTGGITIWLMSGATLISMGTAGAPDAAWQVAGAGDFNGDGRADLLLRHSAGAISLWLMNGTTPISQIGIGTLDPAWRVAGVADCNADGLADIVWQHSNGLVVVWLMNGATVIGSGITASPGTAWQVVTVGDFNGDRRADLILRHSSGLIAIWLMNGVTVINGAVLGTLDLAWDIVGAGDVNGDLRVDIVFRHSSGVIALWLMNGTTIESVGVPGNPGSVWQIAGMGDLNGDSLWDIVLRHTSGAIAVWFMNGAAIAGTGMVGGLDLAWQIVGLH